MLKKDKSPGIVDITVERIQAGAEKETHAICYQIWQERRIPEDWGKFKVKTEEN
jgi:hypothetical protein